MAKTYSCDRKGFSFIHPQYNINGFASLINILNILNKLNPSCLWGAEEGSRLPA